MLGRLFGRRKTRRAADVPLTYEQEKALASQPDVSLRTELAAREDVRPEILYFLADDKSKMVRREIARNTLRLAKPTKCLPPMSTTKCAANWR